MKLTRLSAEDFDRLASRTEMGAGARLMAKGFLVERRTLSQVAAEHDVSKQRVHLAVETIRKEYMRAELASGWLELEIELPHPLAVDIERLAAALSQQPDESLRQTALVKIARAIASAEHALLG